MQAALAITCLVIQGAIASETSHRVTLEIGVSREVGRHIRSSQTVLMSKIRKTSGMAIFDVRSSSQEGKRNQTSHAARKRKTSHKRSWRRRLKSKKATNDANIKTSHAGFLRKASHGVAIVVNSPGDVLQTPNAMSNHFAASGLSADTLNASDTIQISQKAALGSIQSQLWHTIDPHNGMWRHMQCVMHGKSFIPKLVGQNQTFETSAPFCQRRCRSVPDCAHFSFRTDCTCLLHGANVTEIEQIDVISGPPSCIAWQTISSEFSCEDAPGVTRLTGEPGMGTLEQCKEACVLSEECTAIDWFSETKFCNLFDRACDNPTLRKDGSSSHVMLQPLRKTKKGDTVSHEYFQEQDETLVQERRFYVGVISDPGNKCKRDKIRQTWKRNLDRNPNITVEFIVGHTALENRGEHFQGQKPTCQKYELEHQLQAEEFEHGDMRRVAIPEIYANLVDKVIAMFDIAIQRRYAFIFKIDDDFDLQENAMSKMDRYNSTQFLYVGRYYWPVFFDERMRSSDGSFAPFMGGRCYALSWTLANSVFVKHRQHTMSFLSYASSSEDVSLGHWVHFEKVLGAQIVTERLALGENRPFNCNEYLSHDPR